MNTGTGITRKRNWLDKSITTREVIFTGALVFCMLPFVSPPWALLLGIFTAQVIGHPFLHLNHKATHILLQVSVVGLGFGMNLQGALKAGQQGFVFTIASISATLLLGWGLGRWLRTDRKTSHLIACGTAICGGSAIAAISPVIRAGDKQVSVALGTVFILNSIALFLFPVIGHALHLSQTQFGLWSAIAIHDTSAVVGAANKYGPEALQVATTVKLARALWIMPVALLTALFSRQGAGKVKIPWFILLFVLALLLHTWFPMPVVSGALVQVARTGLTLTLFLIGAGLSREVLKSVGARPLVQGVGLWVAISGAALYAVLHWAV